MLRNLFKTICCVLLILPAMALQAQNDFVKTAIDATKRQYAPDSRTAIFAVEGELLNDSLCVLKGRCNNRQAVDALLHRLDSAGIACVDGIKMLPDKNLGALTRGLVTVCCASLRGGPRHAAEMMTQAIMGTPLLVLERDKAWLLVLNKGGKRDVDISCAVLEDFTVTECLYGECPTGRKLSRVALECNRSLLLTLSR